MAADSHGERREWVSQLAALADDAGGHDQTEWQDVVADATSMGAAVTTLELAVDAGLATDEVWITATDHWPPDVAEAIHRISPDINLSALRFLHGQALAGWINNAIAIHCGVPIR